MGQADRAKRTERLNPHIRELRGLGYEGSLRRGARYARSARRTWGSDGGKLSCPLSFAPGEAYQFDWSHEF